MHEARKWLIIIAALALWACNTKPAPVEKPLVFEGMSSADLVNAIGQPARIDSSGVVFDAINRKKLPVQKWYYPKRIVIVINDTVTNPNLDLKP